MKWYDFVHVFDVLAIGSFTGFGFYFFMRVFMPNSNVLFQVWFSMVLSIAIGYWFCTMRNDEKPIKKNKGAKG